MSSNEKGQSLMEVIVASFVGILVVSALTFATIFSLRNASFAKNSALATKLAQEGIERVKVSRDRNRCIKNLADTVKSWNGGSTDSECSGAGSIWDYRINGTCTTALAPNCYFNISNVAVLTYLTSGSSIPDNAESPPSASNFKRVVILSDDASGDSYKKEKQVTVIVTWSDFAGAHESKLTTVLRKL